MIITLSDTLLIAILAFSVGSLTLILGMMLGTAITRINDEAIQALEDLQSQVEKLKRTAINQAEPLTKPSFDL